MVKRIFLCMALFVFVKPCFASQDYFMEMGIASKNLYVSSEIIIQLKIYNKFNGIFGKIPNPSIQGPGQSEIKNLTTVPQTTTSLFGSSYYVLEYNYAAFLSSPGIYTVEKLNFNARINGKNVELNAPGFKFVVKPLPNNGEGELPAAFDIETKSGFNIDKNEAYVGEAIRRSVALKIIGSNQNFPLQLNVKKVPDVKFYESQIKQTQTTTPYHLVQERIYNYIYIPQKEGLLYIPDIKIEWFDINNEQIKETKIKGYSLNIAKDSKNKIKKAERTKDYSQISMYYFYTLMSCLVVLLLFVVLYNKYNFYLYNKISEIKFRSLLKKACKEGDAKKTIEFSVKISNFLKDANIKNTKDLVELLADDDLKKQIEILNESIFKGQHNWDGKDFYQIYMKALNKNKKQKDNAFPWLYPFK